MTVGKIHAWMDNAMPQSDGCMMCHVYTLIAVHKCWESK